MLSAAQQADEMCPNPLENEYAPCVMPFSDDALEETNQTFQLVI